MPRVLRLARTICIGVVLACMARPVCADIKPEYLEATSSAEHVWLLFRTTDQPPKYHLFHHALAVKHPWIRLQRTLESEPEAIAAWGDRVWILFPARAGTAQLQVRTLLAVAAPAGAGFVTAPANRLGVVAPLSTSRRVLGFVGAGDGLTVLLGNDEAADEPGHDHRLLRLTRGAWEPIELPASLRDGTTLLPGPTAALLEPTGEGTARLWRRDEAGVWLAFPIDGVPATIDHATFVAGLRQRVITGRRDGVIESVKIRPAGSASFVKLEVPEGAWAVLGVSDGLRQIVAHPDQDMTGMRGVRLTMRTIDGLSRIGEPVTLTLAPFGGSTMWHLSLLLAVAVTVSMLVLIVRPASRGVVELPADVMPLAIGLRATALLIDLLPGAAWALVVMDGTLADLLRAPLLTPDLDDSRWCMTMIAIAVGHGFLLECICGASLGKIVMGGRIVGLKGERASILRLALRSVTLMAILMLPPLVLLSLVNPHLQGVHDLVARTVVIDGRRRAPASGDTGDDGRAGDG
jgi:uncharacterized RDD family membrane protein YckC